MVVISAMGPTAPLLPRSANRHGPWRRPRGAGSSRRLAPPASQPASAAPPWPETLPDRSPTLQRLRSAHLQFSPGLSPRLRPELLASRLAKEFPVPGCELRGELRQRALQRARDLVSHAQQPQARRQSAFAAAPSPASLAATHISW